MTPEAPPGGLHSFVVGQEYRLRDLEPYFPRTAMSACIGIPYPQSDACLPSPEITAQRLGSVPGLLDTTWRFFYYSKTSHLYMFTFSDTNEKPWSEYFWTSVETVQDIVGHSFVTRKMYYLHLHTTQRIKKNNMHIHIEGRHSDTRKLP